MSDNAAFVLCTVAFFLFCAVAIWMDGRRK